MLNQTAGTFEASATEAATGQAGTTRGGKGTTRFGTARQTETAGRRSVWNRAAIEALFVRFRAASVRFALDGTHFWTVRFSYEPDL